MMRILSKIHSLLYPRQSLSKIINELEYAKSLHKRWVDKSEEEQIWAGGRQEQINIIKNKNIVIDALQSNTNKEKAITILTEWINTHKNWIHKVRISPSKAEKAGDVKWHKRWIKTYKDSINILKLEKIL